MCARWSRGFITPAQAGIQGAGLGSGLRRSHTVEVSFWKQEWLGCSEPQVLENPAHCPRFQITRSPIGDRSLGSSRSVHPNPVAAFSITEEGTSITGQEPGELSICHTLTMTSVDMGSVGMEMKSICDGGDPWSVMWDSMKAGARSAMMSRASGGVSAHARQPGRAGTSAMYLSGSVDSDGPYTTTSSLYHP